MGVEPPYSLLAEVTHACPLRCAYCSNPIELRHRESELSTDEWKRAILEAGAMGVLQIHFSGGEPLIRQDLEEMVRAASQSGMYSNLITSGISLTRERMHSLCDAGLDSVQISVQDSKGSFMAEVTGFDALEAKLSACSVVRDSGKPLTVNIVLNRINIARLEDMVMQAVESGASRIELANAQYHGWAFINRDYLVPSSEQIRDVHSIVSELRKQLPGVEILHVLSDYFQEFPKACMGGWGRLHLTIDPAGYVLPCPGARVIDRLDFPSARNYALKEIWYDSPAFNIFRGDDWMLEPCRSCDRKELDYGGCRCQSFMYTGNANATDPVCQFSEHKQQIDRVVMKREEPPTPILRNFDGPVRS